MTKDIVTMILSMPKEIMVIPNIANINTRILDKSPGVHATVSITFPDRTALILVEVRTDPKQCIIRFRGDASVIPWTTLTQLRRALSDDIVNIVTDYHNRDITTVLRPSALPVVPPGKYKYDASIAAQIIYIFEHEICDHFIKRVSKIKALRMPIRALVQHAEKNGWSSGQPLPNSTKEAIPLMLSKMSSKKLYKLQDVVSSTQSR